MASTKKFLLLGLVLVASIFSACRVVVDTEIDRDGSGELQSSIVYSAAEKQNFENSPGNAGRTICDNLKQDAPPNTRFIQEQRGDETFCTTLRTFKTLKELSDLYSGMESVTVDELRWGISKLIFEVQVDLTSKNGNTAAANEWRLTLPGKVGNNNADAVDNQTLIWNIQPGQVRTLYAESDVPPNSSIVAFIAGAILILGSVLAVTYARSIAQQKEQHQTMR